MKKIAYSYIWIFGLLHVVVIPLGFRLQELGPILSSIALLMMWAASWIGIYYGARWFRVVMAIIFSIAWAYQWSHVYTWIPPWTDLQYAVIATMDFIQAISFAYLAEIWDLKK